MYRVRVLPSDSVRKQIYILYILKCETIQKREIYIGIVALKVKVAELDVDKEPLCSVAEES